MSGLAAIYNVPGTPEELLQWSFAHAANHKDILNALYVQAAIVLPEYVLDPINVEDQSKAWNYLHQTMHNDQNSVLEISGYNLTEVDWTRPESLAIWIALHADEHRRACDALGIA